MDALAAIQAQIKQVQEKSEEGQKAMTLDTTIGFAETTSFEIKKPEAEQGTQEKKKELFGEVEMAVGGGPDLTESQQQGLVQIEKNQQEVDQILEMISSGIDDLQGMAEGMGDEIAKQNKRRWIGQMSTCRRCSRKCTPRCRRPEAETSSAWTWSSFSLSWRWVC